TLSEVDRRCDLLTCTIRIGTRDDWSSSRIIGRCRSARGWPLATPCRSSTYRAARISRGRRRGNTVRKTILGLLRSSRPVLLMTVLVAVVGVTGTAYAGNHDSGNKK